MSTAFRIVLVIAVVAIAIVLLLGPVWRGSFYQSWLRPRLIALGLLLVLIGAGEYLFRVITALKKR